MEKPQGVVAVVKAWISSLIAFVLFFLQSVINPEAASKQNADKRRPGGGGGSGSGGGRLGGGPRITGIDKISGGSHGTHGHVAWGIQLPQDLMCISLDLV